MQVTINYDWYRYRTELDWPFFWETKYLEWYSEEYIRNEIEKQVEYRGKREKFVKDIYNQITRNFEFDDLFYRTFFEINKKKYYFCDYKITEMFNKIKDFVNEEEKYFRIKLRPNESLAKELTDLSIKRLEEVDLILESNSEGFPNFKSQNDKWDINIIEYFCLRNQLDEPKKWEISREPMFTDEKYNIGFMLFWKEKKKNEMKELYEQDYSERKKAKDSVEKKYQTDLREYKKLKTEQEKSNEKIKELEIKIKDHRKNAEIGISEILSWYKNWDKLQTERYMRGVLLNSSYPAFFPKQFELEYNQKNQILILDYFLPEIESFPTLNEIRYIKSKEEIKEFHIKESKISQLFDFSMYATTLRVIKEVFDNDNNDKISAVSFNWWVNCINKTTWKREDNCILSIQIKKDSFVDIELENVDPKSCFKSFKWIWSAKLSWITPVVPILQMNKTDKRFSKAYEVVNKIDTATNLASMDREDFEHLVREIFEKEFSGNWWEVKITQASKDWWVDAVAFDPDPIRWWKIVIQAKRYTNTVWVSAVRDLYWTVMNEWATKWILVTTSDYWADSYEFAKGKPITLLNWANLLYLLEKHWHNAKIDIKEAKKLLE